MIQVLLHQMYLLLYWHQQMRVHSVEPHVIISFVNDLDLPVSQLVVHVGFQLLQDALLANEFPLLGISVLVPLVFSSICAHSLPLIHGFEVLLLLG